MFYLARDKNEELYLYVGSAPVKSASGDTYTTADITTECIHIDETEKKYEEVTFENSPVQCELVPLQQ